MARIGIIGSEGRMGHALTSAIVAAGHENAGGVDRFPLPPGRVASAVVCGKRYAPPALSHRPVPTATRSDPLGRGSMAV